MFVMKSTETASDRSLITGENLVAAGLGFIAGSVAKSAAMEVFAHQELAHHTLKVKPWLNKTSRVVLAAYGLSANKFALRHRKHHRTDHIEPRDSVVEGIAGALISSGTNEELLQLSDPSVRDWSGEEVFDDPLIQSENGDKRLKHDPWYEKLVAKGGLKAAVVPALGYASIYTAARLARANRPAATAAAFIGASLVPLGLQPAATSYAEARAGISDGRINTDRLRGPLKAKVVRHDEHHEKPWRYDLGITPVDRLVIKAGLALGQVEELEPRLEEV